VFKDYKFKDPDIEGVTFGKHNLNAGNVELLINTDCEAVLVYKDDVIAMAKHFGIIKEG